MCASGLHPPLTTPQLSLCMQHSPASCFTYRFNDGLHYLDLSLMLSFFTFRKVCVVAAQKAIAVKRSVMLQADAPQRLLRRNMHVSGT